MPNARALAGDVPGPSGAQRRQRDRIDAVLKLYNDRMKQAKKEDQLKEENDRAAHSLHAVLSTSRGTAPTPEGTPSFKDLLAVEGLGVKMLEGVFGDGWDGQCPCRLCKREWLNAG